MRIRVILVATLLVAVLVPTTAQASHSWGNYHWARTTPSFTLMLGDNLDSSWASYLVTTSNDWSASNVLDTTIVAGTTSPRQCNASSGRVEVCNDTYGNNGWLGVAGIAASGSHITSSYVKLNDSYYNTSTYNTPAWRNLVMCQEVGHALGLDHQDENQTNPNLDTCMDYTNNPESNQHPNAHDYDQLETIYSHLDTFDSYDTGGATDPGPGNGKGKKPKNNGKNNAAASADWGQLVASTARTSTYRKVVGNETFITHVFWAEGFGDHVDH